MLFARRSDRLVGGFTCLCVTRNRRCRLLMSLSLDIFRRLWIIRDMQINATALTGGVTVKSVALALILIPVNCYWIMYTEMVWWGLFPTTMSLFFNAVFFLFCITLLNLLLRKWTRSERYALTHGELLVIYIMLCMASAVASHDHAQVRIRRRGLFSGLTPPKTNGARAFRDRWGNGRRGKGRGF